MGWRELNGWRREMERSRSARQEGQPTDEGSWAGRDQDPFWQEADQLRERARGRMS